MVRLKDPAILAIEVDVANLLREQSFNSTMVRLKVMRAGLVGIEVVTLFQFHNGSIKRELLSFHFERALISFNSTMVRLKDVIE